MSKKQACHLVWFRNDLRIIDNKALSFACADPQAKVIALFTATPEQWKIHNTSLRQITFIHQNLIALRNALSQLGIPLICQTVSTFLSSAEYVLSFSRKENVDKLFFNYQYEFNERHRDSWLMTQSYSFSIHAFDDALLLPPKSVTNTHGEMYQVYTPFRRAFLSQLTVTDFRSLPAPTSRLKKIAIQNTTSLFEYTPIAISPYFPAGEIAALNKLKNFCREIVKDYQKHRDIPALNATSQLSPYLAIGVLSPRQCLNHLITENPQVLDSLNSSSFSWLNELIWREFYHHLLIKCPYLCYHQPFLKWTQYIQWNISNIYLESWKKGITGYPIVDAGMRQLTTIGWMHNRVRMITASFLTKDLLIDWRLGEQFFMQQLIDGTLAANNGGWQWAASTGVDASPWFRIFNPTIQGKKFDPKGIFVRFWLPELRIIPDKYIHTPHEWAKIHQIILDYPKPIVSHQEARLATLKAFKVGKIKAEKLYKTVIV